MGFFPRSCEKLISVLIPTRGRPQRLFRTLDSIVKTASDLSQIEVLLKIDDDKDIGYSLPIFPSGLECRVITSPRGRAFADLDRYFNELAAESKGDWLAVFNDDALFIGHGWDTCIRDMEPAEDHWYGTTEICVLQFSGDSACLFPMMRKRMYELLGHASNSPHIDSYIQAIAAVLRCTLHPQGMPFRHEQGGDAIHEETRKIQMQTSREFHNKTGPVRKAIQSDIRKCQKYLSENGIKLAYDMVKEP